MTEIALAISKRSWNGLKIFLYGFYAQWPMFVVPGFFFLTNYILFARLPHHNVAKMIDLLADLFDFSIPATLLVLWIANLLRIVVLKKPEHQTRVLIQSVADFFVHPSRIINGVPVLAAMIFLNKAMVELKFEIPKIQPFAWDETFSKLDRALHFGVDPWVLLQPIMGYDAITFASNILYNFWFIALFGIWIWFAFQAQATELRTRFLLSYMLVWWLGGGLMAVAFSSAGPAYYTLIGLPHDPYVGLMAYLNDVNTRLPIWSLDTQRLLWDGYQGRGDPLGISAFPSMHNGSAILFALAMRHVSKPLGYIFSAYAIIIMVTSVHLGWHYAVDGYVAIMLGLLCWWIAAPMARYIHRRPEMIKFNQALAEI